MRSSWGAAVGVFVAVSVFAGGASADQDETPEIRANPPPPRLGDLKPPDGRLMALGATRRKAVFLSLDQIQRHAGNVTAVIYEVSDPPIPAGHYQSNQIVWRVRFDCSTRQRSELGLLAYDASGRLVMWTPSGPQEPTDANSTLGAAADVLCEGANGQLTVTGHAAALALAGTLRAEAALAPPASAQNPLAACQNGAADARIAACGAALANGELSPGNRATAYQWRGIAHADRNEDDLAVVDFTAAIDLDPKSSDAYGDRALAYERLHRFRDAIADLSRSISLHPDDYPAYIARGYDEQQTGDLNAAEVDFEKVVELAPTAPDGYEGRGVVFELKGDPLHALPNLEKAIALKSDSPIYLTNRSDAERALGEFDKAIADLDQAIALDPARAKSYEARGILRAQRREFDAALADFNQAVRLAPDHPADYVLRGIAERSLGRVQESAADFAKAEQLDHGIVQRMTAHPPRSLQ